MGTQQMIHAAVLQAMAKRHGARVVAAEGPYHLVP
jgi:hypothetical protein